MSFAQQREFDKDSREDIVLNAVSQFLVHQYVDLYVGFITGTSKGSPKWFNGKAGNRTCDP